MNQIVVFKIIEKLKLEKCPIHEESVELRGLNNTIVVDKCCCKEFYNYIGQRIQKELEKLSLEF